MNVIAWLESEIAYHDVTFQHISYKIMRTCSEQCSLNYKHTKKICDMLEKEDYIENQTNMFCHKDSFSRNWIYFTKTNSKYDQMVHVNWVNKRWTRWTTFFWNQCPHCWWISSLVQMFMIAACRPLFITGKNADLIVITMWKNSVL